MNKRLLKIVSGILATFIVSNFNTFAAENSNYTTTSVLKSTLESS